MPAMDKNRPALKVVYDKKKAAGSLHFALPVRIGKVFDGIAVENIEEIVQEI